jgi:hypothetical protein
MTVLTIGGTRCSWRASRNTSQELSPSRFPFRNDLGSSALQANPRNVRGPPLPSNPCNRAIGQSDNGILHIAFNYVVCNGRRVCRDTKTHQDRYLAIDPVTCAMIREHLDTIRSRLAAVGLELPKDAYVFSNDPMGANPWNPDWVTQRPATWRPRPVSGSMSKGCATTRLASCSRRGSTCVTPRRASVMAAAVPPRCGTTPTPYLRLAGEPPPTSRS